MLYIKMHSMQSASVDEWSSSTAALTPKKIGAETVRLSICIYHLISPVISLTVLFSVYIYPRPAAAAEAVAATAPDDV